MKAKRTIAGLGVAAVLVGGGTAVAVAAGGADGADSSNDAARAAVTSGQVEQVAARSGWVSAKQAGQIARKRTGGVVEKVERDWEHGRKIWEVELHKGRYEYDVDVDRKTGKILRVKRELDD